jgi:hypothetical protein
MNTCYDMYIAARALHRAPLHACANAAACRSPLSRCLQHTAHTLCSPLYSACTPPKSAGGSRRFNWLQLPHTRQPHHRQWCRRRMAEKAPAQRMQAADDSSSAQRPSCCCEASDGIWLPRQATSGTGEDRGRGGRSGSYALPHNRRHARASMRRRLSMSESDAKSVRGFSL